MLRERERQKVGEREREEEKKLGVGVLKKPVTLQMDFTFAICVGMYLFKIATQKNDRVISS